MYKQILEKFEKIDKEFHAKSIRANMKSFAAFLLEIREVKVWREEKYKELLNEFGKWYVEQSKLKDDGK